ncbi:hypothetical protein LMG31506_05524 [Cupriavidus yeoncheonensis]|uniref:BPL/LPL catalytic domain-containing protein n=1 Tax=Cupriavidus yeoncheonensis TaxID=1462994 RepID=A0A916IZA7_9BURK|nr:lipoate--protein ligase family protein [Cupriavidus yeoncheonensis]CAG2155853.1 hypothetical protein LMG31506_05524 [Cupriavidus yeoncheonensis]
MPFAFIETDPAEGDPLQAELALLDLAAQGNQVAQLWEAPVSLVVPRSYLRYERFEAARASFGRDGCPVWLRMSGGGLVPQGPGILNLSLAYSVDGLPGALSEAVYLHLCEVVGQALRTLDVDTHWQAVDGSFCDGRFNLAWGPPGRARKIAGTAQYWRRAPAAAQAPDGQRHLVLAHAVLLVNADPLAITRRANDFEAEAGTGRHYDADKVVSVQQAIGIADPDGARLMERVVEALRASVAATPPPQG